MTSRPLYQWFHEKKVSEFINEALEIQTLKGSQTVEDAVRLLNEKKILGAPVIGDDDQVLGMIDMLDILKYIVSVAPDEHDIARDELQSLTIAGRAMAFKPLSDVLNFSGRDPYVPVYVDSPITQVIDLFSKGTHRTVVVDKDGSPVSVISQRSIVRVLASNIDTYLKRHADNTADKLGLGVSAPLTVKSDSVVLDTIKQLEAGGYSSVGVVDESGKLIGDFSASNLKAMYQEKFPSFLSTASEYLEKHSPGSLKPVAVETSATLSVTLNTLLDNNLHRVWVLDGDFKPAGVITLTDIMKLICNLSE